MRIQLINVQPYLDGNIENRNVTAMKKHKTKQDLFTCPVLSYRGIIKLIYHKHTIIYGIVIQCINNGVGAIGEA